MAPLTVTVDSFVGEQLQKDKARDLAINLVANYLRTVVKSNKLADKFEEQLSIPLIKSDSRSAGNIENIAIEEVMKKHISKSSNNKGTYQDDHIYIHILLRRALILVSFHFFVYSQNRFHIPKISMRSVVMLNIFECRNGIRISTYVRINI